LIAGEDAVE